MMTEVNLQRRAGILTIELRPVITKPNFQYPFWPPSAAKMALYDNPKKLLLSCIALQELAYSTRCFTGSVDVNNIST